MASLKAALKKNLASRLVKPTLKLHSLAYEWSGKLAVISGGGTHPKHDIIRYHEWFLANIEPNWVVVDVGCHWGMMAAVMAEKASFVYGVELESSHVEAARKRFRAGNLEFICADATKHDFSSCRPVDCITLSNVLEHVEERVNFIRRLIENVNWRDPARKRFLVRVPMIDREWIAVYKKKMGLDYRLDRTHFIEYTARELEQELADGGLKVVSRSVTYGESFVVCEAVNR